MSKEFPGFPLHSLPPKIPNIMLTASALEDRLVAFDSLVKKVAEAAKLCNGNSLLDFLGVSSHKRIEVFRQTRLAKKKQKQERKMDAAKHDEEDADDGLFTVKETKAESEEEEEKEELHHDEEEQENGDKSVEEEEDHPLAAGKIETVKVERSDVIITDTKTEVKSKADDDVRDLKVSSVETAEGSHVKPNIVPENVDEEEDDDELFKNLPKPRVGYKGR